MYEKYIESCVCVDNRMRDGGKTSEDVVVVVQQRGGLGENIRTEEHGGRSNMGGIRKQAHQVTDNIGRGRNR